MQKVDILLFIVTLVAVSLSQCLTKAFIHGQVNGRPSIILAANSFATTEQQSAKEKLESSVDQLKKVLVREYTSFFDPMEREYYRSDVTFQDPLTTLSGIDPYQNNVDMLSGRTFIGSLLFSDAGINLHSVAGGEVSFSGDEVSISDVTTRWTLRFCFKALPWKPMARFSGISVYQVETGGSQGVRILQQDDFWDSINLQSDGSYSKVDKSIGLSDFVEQLKPSDLNAPSAGPELPYELLRRGRGYDVRRYPSFIAAKVAYERRDEGFGVLGSFTRGMNPLAPAIMEIDPDGEKSMLWPLTFADPGEEAVPPQSPRTSPSVELVTVPSSVVAVGRFSEASVEPVVRKATRELRQASQRDGLILCEQNDGSLQFCQYDAIFSMGKRRGEVWIPLKDQHPWSGSS